ncbi:tRNA 2-thiouridine(34) synthase MnmA, partial [candidate division KSB1 bacterium]|nr:tRNA 2-thiouridine(34) synthase MnmA [candidate division KSB1 bacterium]NIR71861.1 tRNA 2-thiouridine(34) synthase MnmA [candidate division KSB1 bacterium]NIS26428.1 tRNA 2-thiouridine(34) synthase MnmA [candidate division KSB1 bacterium]NIT73198.1 tRNA 2-thiouridine(34) synthase MnmA [candidate division KSB1 bacterium]NIU27112.1 tRNA 2-thiouridine(34) synthase MnmA [candidate division KSB1 bacterium]
MSQVNRKEAVLVAMSGGVDSSVAAALLHDRGYDVIGVTMNLWDYDRVGGNINRDSGCCTIDTMDDARSVCHTLGVPHYVVNFREEFEAAVTDNFISEYMEGRTPNPCVRCNTYIKWGVLLQKAQELGVDKIATGHYARSSYDEQSGRFCLKRGVDKSKDQSYALWGIRQQGLAQTLFPVGEYTKEEIRQIARRLGLRTAEKSESQEICFIPDNNYKRYLTMKRPELTTELADGEILDQQGNKLGNHKGFPFYTIGQRKGLGIAVGEPVYVTQIDAGSNRVTVGSSRDLEHVGLIAENVNWVSLDGLDGDTQVEAKIRYNDPGAMATVRVASDDTVDVIFDEPQRAV